MIKVSGDDRGRQEHGTVSIVSPPAPLYDKRQHAIVNGTAHSRARQHTSDPVRDQRSRRHELVCDGAERSNRVTSDAIVVATSQRQHTVAQFGSDPARLQSTILCGYSQRFSVIRSQARP